MKEDLRKEIALPDGVSATVKAAVITVKGPQGEVTRTFLHPKLELKVEGATIVITAQKASKREKKIVNSFAAHIKNIVTGVQDLHTYKLKICSSHFPMNVTVAGQEVVIKNFLGESVPRKVQLLPGAEVKISGNEIVVSGTDKEAAGQMAARIETACRITNRDIRIFQDGCYIFHKAGKEVV